MEERRLIIDYPRYTTVSSHFSFALGLPERLLLYLPGNWARKLWTPLNHNLHPLLWQRWYRRCLTLGSRSQTRDLEIDPPWRRSFSSLEGTQQPVDPMVPVPAQKRVLVSLKYRGDLVGGVISIGEEEHS